jgi:nuclear GTP-binding protein
VERIEDPVAVVAMIMQRISAKHLMRLYCVGKFDDAEDLLRQIASARGKLRKGGTADHAAAARFVIQDWNDGRLPYYTKPPTRGNLAHESAALVEGWGADFDAEAVYAAEATTVIAGLPGQDPAEYSHVQPSWEMRVRFGWLHATLPTHLHCFFVALSVKMSLETCAC